MVETTIESAVGMVVRSGLKRLSGEIYLLDLETLTNSKDLIQEMSLKSLLQIKTGNYTKESNCMYLLVGVTSREGIFFDSLTSK
ncbi:hypothetical protein [Parvimonas parva]|uniref:Uncharacterized protein n=1 Tax=Parvimonas parva TaxID=2769485 RepID=A0ABS1CA57_9FIRM|nr:hypothetical protein [Parvimonas parva]MBK1468769.1 hypothetical protein [Parvimonas parva]